MKFPPINLWSLPKQLRDYMTDHQKTMSTIQDTLIQRQATHGDFSDHAATSQALKDICHKKTNKLNHAQRESIDMICHKIARILCGNPNEVDHWHDIAGYATLVENQIKKNAE